jgi:O-antigen ligase
VDAIARRAPVAVFLVAAFVNGGYHESTYSFLCAAVWLGLALACALRPAPPPSAAVLALAALTVLTLLSALWGQPGEALRVGPLPALYTGILYAAEWAGGTVLFPLRLSIVLVAALGIAGRATGLAAPAPGSGSQRMAWPVTYANGLGLVCALGVILCVGLRPRRPLLGVICLAALVWTFSRSAVAALLIASLVWLPPALRRRPRLAALLALCLLAAALAVARPLADSFSRPVPDTRDARRLVTVSGHGRTLLWHAAWNEGRDHAVAGGGAGTWLRSAMASTARLNLPQNAHSLELETFAELGALGVLTLAVFFAAALRRRAEPAATAVVVAWALVSAIDWDWQLPAATIPALLAAGVLTRRPTTARREMHVLAPFLALVVGAAAALHMLGAIQLAAGHTTRLLPWDARPWIAHDPAKACRIDPRSPELVRAGVRCGARTPRAG